MRPLILLGLLCCLAGSAEIRGPGAVRGHVGGSLTVTCSYDSGYETYVKWWCRGAAWGPCRILVKTDGTEQVVRKGRLTIRDDQNYLKVTVTMEQLSFRDADKYWCGIEKTGTDLGDRVTVSVSPAPTPKPTTTTTTTTTTTNAPTTSVASEETTALPQAIDHSLTIMGLPIPLLLPVISAVLLLLLLAASLLAWRKWKGQKTASGVSPEPTPDTELCYANLTFPDATTTPGTLSRKESTQHLSSGQLSPTNKAHSHLDAREEVCYAHLSLHPCELEPTYANMDPDVAPRASMSPEVTIEYSSIRKPKAGSETPALAHTPL